MSAAQRPFLTASNRCEPPGQTVALDEARSNELETLVIAIFSYIFRNILLGMFINHKLNI